jgi:hypothetical protein
MAKGGNACKRNDPKVFTQAQIIEVATIVAARSMNPIDRRRVRTERIGVLGLGAVKAVNARQSLRIRVLGAPIVIIFVFENCGEAGVVRPIGQFDTADIAFAGAKSAVGWIKVLDVIAVRLIASCKSHGQFIGYGNIDHTID